MILILATRCIMQRDRCFEEGSVLPPLLPCPVSLPSQSPATHESGLLSRGRATRRAVLLCESVASEPMAEPTQTPDPLLSGEIEAASAFLVLQPRGRETDEGKDTSPVV